MYKQINITWFVAVSLILHAIFFMQYQGQSALDFKESPDSLNVVISRKIIQLHLSNNTADVNLPASKNKAKVNKTLTSKQKEKPVKPTENLAETKADKDSKKKNHEDPKELKTSNVTQSEQQVRQRENVRNIYLEKVLRKIEKNKFYPSLARRRNMQDRVEVSFTLLESDRVSNIEMNGRYKVLRHAAKSAILNALPFTKPPAELRLPFKVKYSMAFNLE